MSTDLFRQQEAELRQFERTARIRPLTDIEADRHAFLHFAAQHRGFRLYAARAAQRAIQTRKHKARAA